MCLERLQFGQTIVNRQSKSPLTKKLPYIYLFTKMVKKKNAHNLQQ